VFERALRRILGPKKQTVGRLLVLIGDPCPFRILGLLGNKMKRIKIRASCSMHGRDEKFIEHNLITGMEETSQEK
jgi:hypothetical protein